MVEWYEETSKLPRYHATRRTLSSRFVPKFWREPKEVDAAAYLQMKITVLRFQNLISPRLLSALHGCE